MKLSLPIVYILFSIIFLIKNDLLSIKENKSSKMNTNTYKALTMFFGFFGIHNLYAKENFVGTLKLILGINFLIYYIFILQKIKKQHQSEFEDFIDKINKKNNLSTLEKENIDKNTIKYTITNNEEEQKEKQYTYQLDYDLDNYIIKNHKNFRIYKMFTEIFSFVNLLYWLLDILHILY